MQGFFLSCNAASRLWWARVLILPGVYRQCYLGFRCLLPGTCNWGMWPFEHLCRFGGGVGASRGNAACRILSAED